VRLDLQLIAMIDDAGHVLGERGITIGPRSLFFGFSASASFSNRFALLHPERVLGVAAGAVGFISLPVSTWNGRTLRYAIGVADLKSLTGTRFSTTTYLSIPHFFFVGELDENDPVNTGVGYEKRDRVLIKSLFGNSNDDWWESAMTVYGSIEASVEFVVYPNVGHQLAGRMRADVLAFLRNIIEQ